MIHDFKHCVCDRCNGTDEIPNNDERQKTWLLLGLPAKHSHEYKDTGRCGTDRSKRLVDLCPSCVQDFVAWWEAGQNRPATKRLKLIKAPEPSPASE
jgi:hypothetical protein